jgi:hypothetical protein
MIIQNLTTFEKKSEYYIQVEVKRKNAEHLLWFSVPAKYKSYLTTCRMDSFLVAMLYHAMVQGENIHLDGTVSEKLLHNINTRVIPIIQSYSSQVRHILVTASKTENALELNSGGVGTGLSGGIDSLAEIQFNLDKRIPNSFRLTHLLFFNVGANGGAKNEFELENVRKVFRLRYDSHKKSASEIGLECIGVDSNIHLFDTCWKHEKIHTFKAAATVLCFQSLFKRYYIASAGWTYYEMIKYAGDYIDVDPCYLETQLLPLLSTESLEIIPGSQEFNRVEKTIALIDYKPAHKYLNVCVSPSLKSTKNCSMCKKCKRTLATLRIIGAEQKFKEAFDLDKYLKQTEKKYFAKLLVGIGLDRFEAQIVSFAEKSNVKLLNYTNIYHVCRIILLLPYELSKPKLRKYRLLRKIKDYINNIKST